MRNIFRAIGRALSAIFRSLVRVWDGGTRAFKMVADPLIQAADTVLDTALGLPAAVLRSVFGSKPQPPAPGQAKEAARAGTQQATAESSREEQVAALMADVRRAARRLADGRQLPPALEECLSDDVLAYLGGLTREELSTLARTPPALLAAHLAGQHRQGGLPNPEEAAARRAKLAEAAGRFADIAPGREPEPTDYRVYPRLAA